MRSSVNDARLSDLKDYVVRHEGHLDKYMGPLIDPKGKRILVLGSGWGTETYWALKNGADHVLGIDPGVRPLEPLKLALADTPDLVEKFEHRRAFIHELEDQPFDAIISNNVFEHVFDLAGTLRDCRRFMPQRGNRICIFTDPLFHSSCGSHLPVSPWAHLAESQDRLRELAGDRNWNEYREGLNGMTLIDFLTAVRESGLMIESLYLVPDRNRGTFPAVSERLPSGLKPMDLLCEGIGCVLAFPQNL